MPQNNDGLEVEFDITFPHIPCALLATDANDPTGQSQSFHIDQKHRVFKHRLDANGITIGRKSRFELGGTLTREDQLDTLQTAKDNHGSSKKKTTTPDSTNGVDQLHDMYTKYHPEGDEEIGIERRLQEDDIDNGSEEVDDEQYCGSCYGAGDEGECCNTCDDVKRAYRRKQWHIPDITKLHQCKHLVRATSEDGEGCNVHGYVALSTGGGNLHFAPDRQWEKEGDKDGKGNGNMLFGGFLDLSSVIDMYNEGT